MITNSLLSGTPAGVLSQFTLSGGLRYASTTGYILASLQLAFPFTHQRKHHTSAIFNPFKI